MKDKTVVITGATSGLGRATALQLAQKGASVVIIARSNTKANEVIKEIKIQGGKAQFIISDLSSMKDTKEAAESITKLLIVWMFSSTMLVLTFRNSEKPLRVSNPPWH